ncbi:ATP-binding protein PhnN [Candidatus Rhodobacter oscarellae]|uniref:Ribose 1,5-bisphosphate phosphokinase PhnN n=1 Tax=Candidatus Rhodobacter oscarellae TaxID=1675527 RepID=A0A0J9EAQ2_9RHOB|nr:phosphonate metabolism protein/1,5-bisphosphokinase (PRPP-forming) PhnN [Candidatus Rhodobacter lobularis]KMW58744.1 ATP-binding protein PhnN [Candidatus Rhodobacter lobularis]
MGGRFIAVVGPSGVGKDTVMQALVAADARLGLVRRVITRPAEAGGEDFVGATEADFAKREAAGEFALSWPAHGLRYGIPNSVRADLDAGRILLANLSRKRLTEAAAAFPGMLVLNLTAAPEVLAARLAARGRETEEDIAKRLTRRVALPEGLDVLTLDNGGDLEDTVRAALSHIFADRALDTPEHA